MSMTTATITRPVSFAGAPLSAWAFGIRIWVAVVLVVYGSSVFGELAGVWAFKTVFLQDSTVIERSAIHGSDGTQ